MSLEHHPEYDANLFSRGPAPTKVMVQSGYPSPDRPKPSRGNDLESGQQKLHKHIPIPNGAKATTGVEPKAATTTSLPKVTAKTPFYRTKRGIIILVIITIVLLAAIIGGAVAGTMSAKDSASSQIGSPPPVVSGDSPGGASGDSPGVATDGSSTSEPTTTLTVRLTRTLPITNPGTTSISGLVSTFT